MAKRKVNNELFHNEPAPKHWENEPEQFIYQKDKLQIFQKDLDSLPTITISRVQMLEDAKNVINWVNDNNLTGGWDKWNKIIGHSFIELMKIPVETQKELYSIYCGQKSFEIQFIYARNKNKNYLRKKISNYETKLLFSITLAF